MIITQKQILRMYDHLLELTNEYNTLSYEGRHIVRQLLSDILHQQSDKLIDYDLDNCHSNVSLGSQAIGNVYKCNTCKDTGSIVIVDKNGTLENYYLPCEFQIKDNK